MNPNSPFSEIYNLGGKMRPRPLCGLSSLKRVPALGINWLNHKTRDLYVVVEGGHCL